MKEDMFSIMNSTQDNNYGSKTFSSGTHRGFQMTKLGSLTLGKRDQMNQGSQRKDKMMSIQVESEESLMPGLQVGLRT